MCGLLIAQVDENQTALVFIRAERGGRHLGGDSGFARTQNMKYVLRDAQVAELVDAIDSKSIDGNIMRVRFSPWAQKLSPCNISYMRYTV